ncbi:MAG: protoporphyrinogen oxidase HemJ [Oceanibaculum sp.]
MGDLYSWIKALHVISVIAWMAGMFYLPRLYIYHVAAPVGSPQSETFKVMERRLLRAIINPAMVATFIFGIWMLVLLGASVWSQGWWHVKLTMLVLMSAYHGLIARWRRDFETDSNRRSAKFYRFANEVPTVLMIVIVIMVIVKPF